MKYNILNLKYKILLKKKIYFIFYFYYLIEKLMKITLNSRYSENHFSNCEVIVLFKKFSTCKNWNWDLEK